MDMECKEPKGCGIDDKCPVDTRCHGDGNKHECTRKYCFKTEGRENKEGED